MADDLEKYKTLLKSLARKTPQIVLAYVFGSAASGSRGPLSDYDFAVYLAETDRQKRFDIKFSLIGELGTALKSNKIDVVVINDADNINLKYAVISEGRVIYEKEPYKTIVESRILNEYFDFRAFIDRYQKIAQ
jgi:predicted nucleotidyltransferase